MRSVALYLRAFGFTFQGDLTALTLRILGCDNSINFGLALKFNALGEILNGSSGIFGFSYGLLGLEISRMRSETEKILQIDINDFENFRIFKTYFHI